MMYLNERVEMLRDSKKMGLTVTYDVFKYI